MHRKVSPRSWRNDRRAGRASETGARGGARCGVALGPYLPCLADAVGRLTVVECFTVTSDEAGCRLDHFLGTRLPQYSRARLQAWIAEDRVLVGGQVRKPSHKLRVGDRVEIEPAPPRALRAEPQPIPLEILYEDEDVVAINKPAGMVVHVGAGCHGGTLVNALLHRFGQMSSAGGELRPGIVHRLDRGTSGVMLAARHDAAHRALAAQFGARTVEKVYWAMVEGVMETETGLIERAIARDPVRRIRMTARLAAGRSASTEYRVLERFARFTLLEVRIGTGRTHQIRVHMASLRHPIAGDTLYGAAAQPTLNRPWLHSRRLSFDQPTTGERITVEAPLAAELETWKNRLL
jgi:23S rRNA pseudouridine1911/1915/1917 synthase